ncbi:hypothetical protein BB427_03175 [Pseudoalteromonas sp. BMB]|uniref:DUF3574 domain-containing protein n=1 Tax=Pseudoalteromonas sp. BMB TaxID=1874619 RepID=UPI00083CE046|nr:DUF3574 domain-containing protein [Pseudoalteromonas sp. BMB]ODB35617.1 hypothetical protein BB427_03175 [Pseudoalteromonas sp. BMB]
MLGRILILVLVLFCGVTPLSYANTDDVFRLRLYFGMSLPEGGAVSLAEWESFQNEQITKYFDGFNVVDSVGYYKGQPERSKIVTVIVTEQEVTKAKELASIYAKTFKQDSVMMVKVPVLEWDFIEATSLEPEK